MQKDPPRLDSAAASRHLQGWIVRKCSSHEEMQGLHLRDWQAVSPERRARAAGEMVEEAWKLQGRSLDELRFQRRMTVGASEWPTLADWSDSQTVGSHPGR